MTRVGCATLRAEGRGRLIVLVTLAVLQTGRVHSRWGSMQIIEVTGMGVRSAVINLQRRETPLRFVLFPMVHIGRPEFFAAVGARAGRCALVVAEGRGRSQPKVTLPGLAYRLLRRHRRSRLVIQDIREDTLGVPVVRPDLS